jgi:hypothetical protein
MQTLVGGDRVTSATERSAWKALRSHHEEIRDLHLRDLFASDPSRGERFTAEGGVSTSTIRRIVLPIERSNSSFNWQKNPACDLVSMQCIEATKSTSQKIERLYTSLCGLLGCFHHC